MGLYTGRGKKLMVNLGGQVYIIRNPLLDWVDLIKKSSKTINDVPADLRPLVEELLNKN